MATKLTVEIRGHFSGPGRSVGTEFDNVDFELSEGMYEAELIWGGTGKLNSRSTKNLVPRNARAHVTYCFYCDNHKEIRVVPHGGWKHAISNGNASMIKRRWILVHGKFKRRWTEVVPLALLATADSLGLVHANNLKEEKIAFLKQHFYPFDMDGRNLGQYDVIHCAGCSFSIFVEDVDCGRIADRPDGTLAFRQVDIMEDSRRFFSKLKSSVLDGRYERKKQRALSKSNLR